ncbi:serine/threonine-protein kinase [Thermus scotoductus]|uniref:Serine/threonine protein kinase n=1 Tax=Thermus scotoductus (strain ATCC 700910 / SA-01) TaxID=743525 RepID=E8PNL7_THESS|nr:serine/threonine-protein kinase [Thermus scotoductus]ADW21492.1 serine/threonine protein kinase [Thermus scotoductus SA-01]
MTSLKRKDFRLRMLLGLGQTAQVYLAEAPDGTKVALKLPRKEVRQDPRLAERFAREVSLSLSLKHPHLVQGLYGIPFGEEAFLALEYLEEGTLEERLLKGPLNQEEAMRALLQVGQALLFLHEKGFLHQDVKPSNVFVGKEGYKLGDLGTVRPLAEASLEYAGSPHYLAPELFLGAKPSPKSDAYSFGVMAYELLVGKRPFRGETLEELRNAHLFLPPPPTSLPPRLDKALRRLLAKNPEERLDLKAFLEVLKNPEGPKTEETPPKRKGFLFWRR